jgi:hypothetical protein
MLHTTQLLLAAVECSTLHAAQLMLAAADAYSCFLVESRMIFESCVFHLHILQEQEI